MVLEMNMAALFGQAHAIPIDVLSYCVMSMVIGVMFFEMICKWVEEQLHETPYEHMLEKVYKELMVVGLISLVMFLISQGDYSVDLLHALEYAHALLMGLGVFYLLQAFSMMVRLSLSHSHARRPRFPACASPRPLTR